MFRHVSGLVKKVLGLEKVDLAEHPGWFQHPLFACLGAHTCSGCGAQAPDIFRLATLWSCRRPNGSKNAHTPSTVPFKTQTTIGSGVCTWNTPRLRRTQFQQVPDSDVWLRNFDSEPAGSSPETLIRGIHLVSPQDGQPKLQVLLASPSLSRISMVSALEDCQLLISPLADDALDPSKLVMFVIPEADRLSADIKGLLQPLIMNRLY